VRRYYITAGEIEHIRKNIARGVEYIQIREKQLCARALLALTREVVQLAQGSTTRILVNDRADVALAAGAHGVHLRSDSPPPHVWRRVVPEGFLVAMSCHTPADIESAEGADFVVYGPVFATPGKGDPIGLDGLRAGIARASMPVFALGGIDDTNAEACIAAGAAGVAAIRLFQR
jgi:thiamine-phosphate pyrophosphorylase